MNTRKRPNRSALGKPTLSDKRNTNRTRIVSSIITKEEWNDLDIDSKFELVYGSQANFDFEYEDMGGRKEILNSNTTIDDKGQPSPEFYFEVGPRSLILHVNKKAFRWIDSVR